MVAPVVEIIEIQGRSEQGVHEPFQCRADDGFLYYVKGRNTDRASLCNEWVCGHLATCFGLPVPPFRLVNVSEELLAEAPLQWRSLGTGIAFGSREHPGCTWFSKAQAAHLTHRLKMDIIAFDWWVQNVDRTIGNPNLLWDAANSEIVVIDHNLAFPRTFNPEEFLQNHIFSEEWKTLDLIERAQLQERFQAAVDAVLKEACDNVPEEWRWANPELDLASNMNLNSLKDTVLRYQHPDFWRFQ